MSSFNVFFYFTVGVATQGMGLVDEWTTAYRISFSNKSDDGFKEYSENGNYVKVTTECFLLRCINMCVNITGYSHPFWKIFKKKFSK